MKKNIVHIIFLITMIFSIGQLPNNAYIDMESIDFEMDNESNQEKQKETKIEYLIVEHFVDAKDIMKFGKKSDQTLKFINHSCRESSFTGIDLLDPPEFL